MKVEMLGKWEPKMVETREKWMAVLMAASMAVSKVALMAHSTAVMMGLTKVALMALPKALSTAGSTATMMDLLGVALMVPLMVESSVSIKVEMLGH